MRSSYAYSFLALTFVAIAGAQIVLDPSPARVAGHLVTNPAEQLVVTNVNPNFAVNGGLYQPEGVALDTTGSTPILYVADTGNNRILAWKNATSSTLANQQPPNLIIGQPDACSTLPAINGGLDSPTGLVVDSKGNLYVADSLNNRVLRYPAPFSSSSVASCPVGTATSVSSVKPDIVLGQADMFTSRSPNQGVSVSAKTLYLGSGGSYYPAALALDASGNLYVSDAGNDRVLQYVAASLTAGAADPAASIVIGQPGFTVVNGPPLGRLDRNTLYTPAGLAFDSPAGNLFVSDSYAARLMVFTPPFSNGMAASRLAGIVNPAPAGATASTLNTPEGIVMIDNGPAVLDAGDNRMLIFGPYASWPAFASGDTTFASSPPAAIAVLGQGANLTAAASFTTSAVNAGNPQASFSSSGTTIATFDSPVAAAVAGNGDLFVADTYNNRVLVYPTAGQAAAATEVLGQSGFPYNQPNSIHGREFYFGSPATASDAGIVVDSSGSVPHLYVSDPYNHRVLGFADARKVGPGVQADLVIGEPDLSTALCNFGGVANTPGTEPLPRQPTNASLCYPTGLAVDNGTGPSGAATQGDLFVADSENGRVLRFPAPFAPNATLQADLVLGQTGFTGISNPQASQSVMEFPYGLVFDPGRGLLVSDEAANRVLLFSLANPTSGESASTVFGQPNFVGTTNAVLKNPHHIAEDSIGELYVADSGHGQILVFDIPSGTSADTPINSFTGLNSPQAVWVNTNTVAGYHDDIWVGDSSFGISRYPVPNPLVTSNTPTLTMPAVEITAGQSLNCPGSGFCEYPAIAITQDGYGALYVADASNRVAVHYPALAAENAGSFVCAMGCNLGGLTDPQSYLAPGAFASLFAFNGLPLASGTTVNYVLPVPTTLGGLQVLVNGVPSPITTVSSAQINFVVPFEAPTSGTTPVTVVNPSTSQVVGSGSMAMNVASPAFFTLNQQGYGQIAALNCNKVVNGNCDDAVNGTANPANPGTTIQLYLTGQGAALTPSAPADGQGDCTPPMTGPEPEVIIGTTQAKVSYSGLAPCYVGLWQINAVIPANPGQPPTGFPNGVFPVLVDFQGLVSEPPSKISNPSLSTTIVINAPQ
jgi:uncharacterized protein (TIGR03437 family)